MTLKAAVIGVGSMGRHHARVYAEMEGVELVAVCDQHQGRANGVAQKYDCLSFQFYGRMLDELEIDVASIAVPTTLHLEAARCALRHGCHVLVEKPIAATLAEAQEMIGAAQSAGLVLAVGHIERCNPAVTAVLEILLEGFLGPIHSISIRRRGPSPGRIRDVGVTVDLATHDLDLLRYLTGESVEVVAALLQHRNHGEHEDGVTALLKAGEAVAVIEADWITSAKLRDLVIAAEHGTIQADLLRKSVEVWRRPDECEVVDVGEWEPLRLEIEAFVEAVKGERTPAATGEDGWEALCLALDIQERSGRGGCPCNCTE